MPPRQKIPAPIDRPLSRAYLREFSGWSTAYPPGISDPTSLRVMENTMVNRDGSLRVRPGLRYLSYNLEGSLLKGIDKTMVGTHEPFFLNNGTKAYLFAVRESTGRVGFRVLVGMIVKPLTDPLVGFDVPQGETTLSFSSGTTYVKYLQIDNKIFALSNNGESMRLFTVGSSKTAKVLQSISRPNWNSSDKLIVVHPDAGWVNGSTPAATRYNWIAGSSFTNISSWAVATMTALTRVTTPVVNGSNSGRVESLPMRTNYCNRPLNNTLGSIINITGWSASTNVSTVSVVGNAAASFLRANVAAGTAGRDCFVSGGADHPVTPGMSYRLAVDFNNSSNANGFGARVRWLDSTGTTIGAVVDINYSFSNGRKVNGVGALVAPAGAVTCTIYIRATTANTSAMLFDFANVNFCEVSEDSSIFDGASGADYYWTGAANASPSVWHPAQLVEISTTGMAGVQPWCGSVYVRSSAAARSTSVVIDWLGGAGGTTVLGSTPGTPTNDSSGAWTRIFAAGTPPAGTTGFKMRLRVSNVPRGEYHYFDSAMLENGVSTPGAYFDGSFSNTGGYVYSWLGTAHNSASQEDFFSAGSTLPPKETPTANTLVSSDSSKNVYNFAFFYTFSNEVGECAASKVTQLRAQRPWPAWRWETPNAVGEPSGTETGDGDQCADQLVAYMPAPVFTHGLNAGATSWNLYMFTWSDQDPAPAFAQKVSSRPLDGASVHGSHGWLRATPQLADTGDTAPVPQLATRYNFSDPSKGGQGIVASDRMVLVNDPTAQAVIRWTSNQMGSYTDFSASKGGGYKTLTSGNLYVPATVKLWQNPQSVDTLTILCMGVDGQSTGYYMAPAQVASQSEATNIMGFEETTATPGTVSPYGCEVFNNALYHPLDEMVMKSTATNYNINHKSITDQIQNSWRALVTKHKIVSSVHDSRIYYLVNNPAGIALDTGCWGNEVWVFDAATDAGTWSRWLTPGCSLRKIEKDGQIVMSLVRPDGIYFFDEAYNQDDYVDGSRVIRQTAIPWKIETNTQGANRAHDAWAHLQQISVVLGNFSGTMRYGVRGHNVHGKPVDVSKVVRDKDGNPSGLAYDLEDFLLVQHDLKEWFFYASSELEGGIVQPSYGAINLVQYRYSPVSVNVGYEFGSIETFEYQRAGNAVSARSTDNGVPMPYIDTSRP